MVGDFMNILITGGGGFVGSHVAEAELKKKNKVVALDIADDSKVKHLLNDPNFSYVRKGILEADVLEPLIKESDMIYHFAAIANVQTYVKDPVKVLDINIQGIKIILSLAKKYNKKVVFSSSSEVYGKNLKVPWHEEDDRVLGPTIKHRWCYSISKSVGEHYCFGYAKEGLKVVIVRFFNFYGPRLDFIGKGRVMTCFLEKFLKDEPVTVVEPGDQTRCFTYISDGVDGILKAAHTPEAEGNVFNIGTNKETSMLDLAKIMKKVGNFRSEIMMVHAEKIYGKGYEDIFRRVPDISKAKKILKWEPKVGLEEGLKLTIDSFKNKIS